MAVLHRNAHPDGGIPLLEKRHTTFEGERRRQVVVRQAVYRQLTIQPAAVECMRFDQKVGGPDLDIAVIGFDPDGCIR